jgi:hypothetical protein
MKPRILALAVLVGATDACAEPAQLRFRDERQQVGVDLILSGRAPEPMTNFDETITGAPMGTV